MVKNERQLRERHCISINYPSDYTKHLVYKKQSEIYITRIGIEIGFGIENFWWNQHQNRKQIGIVPSLFDFLVLTIDMNKPP